MQIKSFRKAVLYVVCAFSVLGCSTAAKIEKAKMTVLTNRQASADVFNELSRIWPCVNDTTFISGGRDTIVSYDTVWNKPIGISVEGDPEPAGTLSQVVSKGNTTTYTVTKIVKIHDTLKSVVVDNRALMFQKDSTAKYMNLYYAADNEVKRLNKEHHEVSAMLGYAGKALLGKWWFWTIIVGIVASFWLRGKLSFITNILNKFKK